MKQQRLHLPAPESPSVARPLEEVITYRNPRVIARISSVHGLDPADAALLFLDLLCFLHRVSESGSGVVVPTPRIDKAWHEFLLYTRDYFDFCHTMLGKFIHHDPGPSANLARANGDMGGFQAPALGFPALLEPSGGYEVTQDEPWHNPHVEIWSCVASYSNEEKPWGSFRDYD